MPTEAAFAPVAIEAATGRLARRAAQRPRLPEALFFLLIATSFFVFSEPAPYEFLFVLTAIAFALSGLSFPRPLAVLIVPLLLYNLGGAFALVPFIEEREPVFYIGITFYMSASAIVFAAIFYEDTRRRLAILETAWVLAAIIASFAGMAGYFDIAGLSDIFTLYGRATGTFKDPNVLGPFLCGPALLLIEGLFTRRLRRPLVSLLALLIILAGIFFSFSRGAWGVTVLSTLLCGFLIYVTTPSPIVRLRVIVLGLIGLVLIAFILAAILSVESIRDFFFERFVLLQEYDEGPRGRFGKLTSAILLLLERPNGIGPLHFTDYFPEAPHNAYVNAFSSYGWLGGLAYLAFIAVTFRMGWTAVWKRTPWQTPFIALWSFTFVQYVQGLQIDTDHWRHLWMVVGVTWGAGAAALRYDGERQAGTIAA